MSKRILPILLIFLMTASAAQAQWGGGGMGGGGEGGGGGGRHGGGGKRHPQAPPDSSAPATREEAPRTRLTPLNKVEIIGVIKAIDTANGRMTIAYQPVDALNWPAGTMPFVVEKPQLMQGATVGEKVRFKIESQQISEIEPYTPRPGDQASN